MGTATATELSPYAALLLHAMTGPASEGETFRTEPPDLARVSDEELGTLVTAAYAAYTAVQPGAPVAVASWVRLSVEQAGRERQPAYSPEAGTALFDALVTGLPHREWADLTLGVGALLRCTGAWPDVSAQARTLVAFLLDRGRLDHPFALLAAAGLAGDRPLRKVAGRLKGPALPLVKKLRADALYAEEIDLVVAMEPTQRALLAEIALDRPYGAPRPLPDAWERLAAVPAYAAFAQRALTAAGSRAAAIQAGEIPYGADKAFTADEVATLGRATRVALFRDEAWLPGLLDRLLPAIAVAPTTARTLPSQALLYEVARAAQDFPTPEAATALRTVRAAVRHKGVPKRLDRMLKRIDNALADRVEVALRLPCLGFGPDGVLRVPLGDRHQAVVTVADETELTWCGPGGRALRAVPAAVRAEHRDTVREVRDLVKRVRAHLATLTRALESGLTAETVHPYGKWRDELAAHPLAWSVVGRLIWEVEVSSGEWVPGLPAAHGTVVHDRAGRPVGVPGDGTAVRLWHPIRSTPGEVRAWRDLLAERGLRQPFKQAYREIYLLTPAEEETRVYSNRFAAHVMHYRRLYALFKGRSWVPDRFLGPWDGGQGGVAVRTFAGGEWRASLFHEWAEGADDLELAVTDQVRFARRAENGRREAPLAEVPAIVFSEAMRDVDLFVGVGSIAADPHWIDRGEQRHVDYWHGTGFGELTENARVRRDALSRILPRTRLADRCELTDRFLVVRGELRTYKIHLGSANILMEPDDSYLCIVPDRRGAASAAAGGDRGGTVFLPFEDDRLSLILSKAFLLADDAKITDPTILHQIERGAPWVV